VPSVTDQRARLIRLRDCLSIKAKRETLKPTDTNQLCDLERKSVKRGWAVTLVLYLRRSGTHNILLTSRWHYYSKTNQMHQCLKFILFWKDKLHVSDGLSVHHQEFTTVHTATGICQTDTATAC